MSGKAEGAFGMACAVSLCGVALGVLAPRSDVVFFNAASSQFRPVPCTFWSGVKRTTSDDENKRCRHF